MKLPFAVVCALVMPCLCLAQSETATLTGRVTDPQGGVVPAADVKAVNIDTNVARQTVSTAEGIYVIPNLPPGRYRITVRKEGFSQIVKAEIVLHVQDTLAENFILQVGSVSESITVTGGESLVNTESPVVGTVVDRQFVENIPLNGRSFQTLIMLTPGTVVTPTSYSSQGQFSINGQRTDANYFTVDGVSANIGIAAANGLGQTVAGTVPGLTTQGGTNGLVSVDALQEFRIQTSSFAPEFGRTPGAQVSIATRSGTNSFHGTLFDYFRNDVLDANDWFVNQNLLRKPPERQNDFGGVLGGPIAKDRTFFFFSYEGLRLRQPQTQTTPVPSVTSRQSAPARMQPFLNAFPVPNGPDLGGGFAQFAGSYSNPSTTDSYSIRVDHSVNSKLALFGRYSYSPSHTDQRVSGTSLNTINTVPVNIHTLTTGLMHTLGHSLENQLRANYSNVKAGTTFHVDDFGGASPIADSALFPSGVTSASGEFIFRIVGSPQFLVGKNWTNEQRQINVLDNLSWTVGAHQMKFGIDYRWLSPISSPGTYVQAAVFSGMSGATGALSGTALVATVQAIKPTTLLIRNFSFYGQDTWRVTPRLTLTYGLRWDVNPALKGKDSSSQPFTVAGLTNPATMALAPAGTSLYNTNYGNVAPRVGVAYRLNRKQGWQSVLRGGYGFFYDIGAGSLGALTQGFPFTKTNIFANVSFPLTSQQAAAPTITQDPPVTLLFVTDPNLKDPRIYQWNVAVEQSLGAAQTISATYVGAVGRDLLRQDRLTNPNATFQSVAVTRNTATSDYHSLQIKFECRLSHGLEALASYTLSHSIDIASDDTPSLNTPANISSARVDRGNSDFDVRHSFTGGFTYDLPSPRGSRLLDKILGGWSWDNFITARSALPVTLAARTFVVAGTQFQARPDVVPGIPLYLFGSQYPGGKIFNNTPNQGGAGCKGPFCNPATNQQGNLARNVLRAFDDWQMDSSVRRRFQLSERMQLQLRAEFFNLLNHPNFGAPTNSLTSPLFGQSTQMLAQSLGTGGSGGGFSPLYQIGGSRSIQLALRLQF